MSKAFLTSGASSRSSANFKVISPVPYTGALLNPNAPPHEKPARHVDDPKQLYALLLVDVVKLGGIVELYWDDGLVEVRGNIGVGDLIEGKRCQPLRPCSLSTSGAKPCAA